MLASCGPVLPSPRATPNLHGSEEGGYQEVPTLLCPIVVERDASLTASSAVLLGVLFSPQRGLRGLETKYTRTRCADGRCIGSATSSKLNQTASK